MIVAGGARPGGGRRRDAGGAVDGGVSRPAGRVSGYQRPRCTTSSNGLRFGAPDDAEGPIGRVAEVEHVGHVAVRRQAEDLAGPLLVADRGVSRADAEVGRGDHHRHRRLAGVVLGAVALAGVICARQHERHRGRRAGHVPGPLPHLRQLAQLVSVLHHHEVPRLPVARGGSPASGLEDAIELLGRQRPVREAAHVAPCSDRLPGVHSDRSRHSPATLAAASPGRGRRACARPRAAPARARMRARSGGPRAGSGRSASRRSACRRAPDREAGRSTAGR